METRNFLLEIGCEELPVQAQQVLRESLEYYLKELLSKEDLQYASSHSFSTPRRIAVLINGLMIKQPPRQKIRQGPSVKAAFDRNGTPTLAFMGFANSCGVSVDQVERVSTPKGEYLFCSTQQPGKTTLELLPEIIQKAIHKLPLSKPMRWGSENISFIRPVHWILVLFGRETISFNVLNQFSGKKTYGHRFLNPEAITLEDPSQYIPRLKEAHVLADYKTRKQTIRESILQVASPYGKPLIDESLLDEVTGLVEWPVTLVGEFHRRYLMIPSEVLICSMQSHQKCFPIVDDQEKLQPYFILISNLKSQAPTKVIRGNERVINARLSDAYFFYTQDLKKPLNQLEKKLAQILFQKDLGTLADKTRRLSSLCVTLAKEKGLDEALVKRAAHLCKCDLLSDMVREFPSLQGTMGYHYALASGEDKKVAEAIKEYYQPKFSKDQIPGTELGQILSISDKIDTLVGIIGRGQIPSGDKDPFALRRLALGILRILIEAALPFDLKQLIRAALKGFNGKLTNDKVELQVYEFFLERLKSFYAEKGIGSDVFESVSACQPSSPLDFDRRMVAVQFFRSLPEAYSLSQAHKRVNNLLKKEGQQTFSLPNIQLFNSEAEKALSLAIEEQQTEYQRLYKESDYKQLLTNLAELKPTVDRFFDEVMVMDEDLKIRQNRLALLAHLRSLFVQVADISFLQT